METLGNFTSRHFNSFRSRIFLKTSQFDVGLSENYVKEGLWAGEITKFRVNKFLDNVHGYPDGIFVFYKSPYYPHDS